MSSGSDLKYSVSSMFFHEYEMKTIFRSVKAAGCTSMEFWLETPSFWMNGLPINDLLLLSKKYHELLPLTIHAPVLDLNSCSINPDVVKASIKWSARAVQIADQLGASVVTIHPGHRTAKRKPGERDTLGLKLYLAEMKKINDNVIGHHVKIGIENMASNVNSLLKNPDSMNEILCSEDNSDWLYFTFDIAHALSISEKNAIEFIDRFYDRIVNVHVSGADKKRIHYQPSKCEGATRVLKHLYDCGYCGPLNLELEDLNFDKKLNIAKKTEIISGEVEYMKSIFG